MLYHRASEWEGLIKARMRTRSRCVLELLLSLVAFFFAGHWSFATCQVAPS